MCESPWGLAERAPDAPEGVSTTGGNGVGHWRVLSVGLSFPQEGGRNSALEVGKRGCVVLVNQQSLKP